LPWEALSAAISQLVGSFTIDKIPILIYPTSYLEEKGIPSKKQYNMWNSGCALWKEYGEYMIANTKMQLKFLSVFSSGNI